MMKMEFTCDDFRLMLMWADIQLGLIRDEKRYPPVNETHYDRLQVVLSMRGKLVIALSKANDTKRGYTYPEFMGEYFPNDTDDNHPLPNTMGHGLMCNIQCYVRDLGNDIDSPLTLMNIEECLVEHASPEDVLFSKGWLFKAAPEDVSQWHPKVISLMRFIEMQILVKSGGQ